MYPPWLIAWTVVAAVCGLQFGILTWSMWENFRFARARLRKTWPRQHEPRVELFAPCKGLELGLRENLRPLFEQDYSNYSLTFVVESADDPVCGLLPHLMADYPQVEARVVVAGLASDTGQKVHNLRAATANLTADVEILAFVDSDARPRSDWLRRLVARLDQPQVGAVTGYRWFRPARPTAAQLLVYSVNSLVAGSFGPGGHHLVWGGSWAIRRELFESLGVRDAWRQTLSDDLVVSRLLHRARLRVEFEPACMVASPLDGGWYQSLEFVRRQYVIARACLPHFWGLALLGAAAPAITFWGGLVLLVVGLWQHAPWTWLPAVICPAYYATTLVRGYQRWLLARLYVREQSPLMKRIVWLDIWTGPLVVLANWLAVCSSLFGNRLRWRGVEYRLGRGGRVVSVMRGTPAERRLSEVPSGEPSLPRPHKTKSHAAA